MRYGDMRRKKISISIKKESLSRADKSQLIRLLKYQLGLPVQRKRTPNLPKSCDIFLKGSSWQKLARTLIYLLERNVIELSCENTAPLQEISTKIPTPYPAFRFTHGNLISERNVIVKLADGSLREILSSLSEHNRADIERDRIGMIKESFMVVERMSDKLAKYLSTMGASLVPDISLGSPTLPSIEEEDGDSQNHMDIISAMGIRELHRKGITGKGTYIAFFDQGIESSMPELRKDRFCRRATTMKKRRDGMFDKSMDSHGTMCAGIAAGRPTKRFSGGVAPDAKLISIQVSPGFYLSNIVKRIYRLIYWFNNILKDKGPIIVCNSWGWNKATPPEERKKEEPLCEHVDFIEKAIYSAIESGMIFSFSAGNNHDMVEDMFDSCGPNSIWYSFKTLADVMVVGSYRSKNNDYSLSNAVNFEVSSYSSRGPGEQYSKSKHGKKPDLVMPAPDRIQVLKKRGPSVISTPWKTSGANAFMSGVLSLYASKQISEGTDWRFDLDNVQTFLREIRSRTVPLTSGAVCQEAQGGGYLNWP